MQEFVIKLGLVIGLYVVYYSIKAILKYLLKGNKHKNKKSNLNGDSEFTKQDETLSYFLVTQKMLLIGEDDKLLLPSMEKKYLYLNFVMGGIDFLTNTIKDKDKADLWFHTTTTAHAVMLLGLDEGEKALEEYGRSENTKLLEAGVRGQKAMQIFLRSSASEITPDGYVASTMELHSVVSGS